MVILKPSEVLQVNPYCSPETPELDALMYPAIQFAKVSNNGLKPLFVAN